MNPGLINAICDSSKLVCSDYFDRFAYVTESKIQNHNNAAPKTPNRPTLPRNAAPAKKSNNIRNRHMGIIIGRELFSDTPKPMDIGEDNQSYASEYDY